jgi:FAD/FMN-containing dehydrogenase
MDKNLLEELKKTVTGEVLFDEETLTTYSHDASLFEVKPQVVVYPKTDEDVQNLVKFVVTHKKQFPGLSLTGRSAGTDMSGGSINDSIIVAFGKYFNNPPLVLGNSAITQPGVFYRDFETEALKKGYIFPSYPASREICAMGGIVNNNSGGEKSLEYGKTEDYVKKLTVVLADGNKYEIKPLDEEELKMKMELKTFEGEIYIKMFELITKNYDENICAKTPVSKKSAGYFLWNVWDKEKKIFDLTNPFLSWTPTKADFIIGNINITNLIIKTL